MKKDKTVLDIHNGAIRVGWVQIGESFGEQYYFPYSVGVLEAYARRYLNNLERYDFITPIYKRLPLADAAAHLDKADIIFFSVYLWNFRSSLEMAEGLKKMNPKTLIVLGGPQIPEQADKLETFLRRYPFVDIGCRGEGEITVLKIIESYGQKRWEQVPSIGYIAPDGVFVVNPLAERISDLDSIPSPYLGGTFDRLMEENPGVKWSAMWETNRGCPFSCAYCAWGAGDKKNVYKYDMDRLFAEIDWFSRKKIEFVFCCDANYGIFSRDLTIAEKVAENHEKTGYPQAFSVQNTKNSTQRIFELQKILNDAGLQKGVNIALQSVNEATLRSINRTNIKASVYRDLQRMFNEAKIPTFSDIIIGLPEETYESMTEGVSSLIEGGQHNNIQFINLTILENTAMAEAAYQEKYGFILQDTEAISHHSSLDQEGVRETQRLVVGTKAMPKDKWVETRVFSWMITLLHFDKLLQIPMVLFNRIGRVSYKSLIELFLSAGAEYPCLESVHRFFRDKALHIQSGGPEYVASEKWLNIWWPPDEYMFISLCEKGELTRFYQEAEAVLDSFQKEKGIFFPEGLLAETVKLNRGMIKEPFCDEDIELTLDWNILEVYRGALIGRDVPLEKKGKTYRINRNSQKWGTWEEWLRYGVWYGAKRGAFFYPVAGF